VVYCRRRRQHTIVSSVNQSSRTGNGRGVHYFKHVPTGLLTEILMVVLCKGYTVTWIDLYFLEGLLMHRQEFEMKEDNGNTLEPLKVTAQLHSLFTGRTHYGNHIECCHVCLVVCAARGLGGNEAVNHYTWAGTSNALWLVGSQLISHQTLSHL
jgi:hypothetical protein